MYRIELAPGEETVFRTIEELAVAVRNGLVTPRCRIYHNATQKWLAIDLHPHYKQALALPAARVAEAVANKTGHPPKLETLTFAVPAAARAGDAPVPEAAPSPAPVEPPAAARQSPEPKPRKRLPMDRAQAMGARAKSPDVEPVAPAPRAEPESDHPVALPEPVTPGAKASETPLGLDRFAPEPPTHQTAPSQPVPAAPAPDPLTRRPAAHRRVLRDPFAPLPVEEPKAPEEPKASEEPVAPEVSNASETLTIDHDSADFASPGYTPPPPPTSPVEPWPSLAPAPAPRPAPAYRPDTYLPPSVRIVADAPAVAMPPKLAALRTFEPRPPETHADAVANVEALGLPAISYPEITPAEEPVAERTGTGRGRRSVQVAIAALVLTAGGYLAKSFYSPVRTDEPSPAAVEADRPELPQDQAAPPPQQAPDPAPSRPAGVATRSALPAKPAAPPAPASSGFAAALEPRAMVSGTPPNLPANAGVSTAPAAPKADSTPSPALIAPAPADIRIDVPALPGGVPAVGTPGGKTDSAMKRILRAVNGGKEVKQR